MALWLCGYEAMWLYGYMAMWLFGYVALWLSGSVAMWSPHPSTYRFPPLHQTIFLGDAREHGGHEFDDDQQWPILSDGLRDHQDRLQDNLGLVQGREPVC